MSINGHTTKQQSERKQSKAIVTKLWELNLKIQSGKGSEEEESKATYPLLVDKPTRDNVLVRCSHSVIGLITVYLSPKKGIRKSPEVLRKSSESHKKVLRNSS